MYLQLHKPVIIALVDILPKNLRYRVDENEIALDGYTLFQNVNARGRGIALVMFASVISALVYWVTVRIHCVFR